MPFMDLFLFSFFCTNFETLSIFESTALRRLLVGSCCALGIDIEDGISNNIGYLITSILMYCRKTDPRQFKQAVF